MAQRQGQEAGTGPLSKNKVNIEISKEPFVEVLRKSVPHSFDYPRFSVNVYSLGIVEALVVFSGSCRMVGFVETCPQI